MTGGARRVKRPLCLIQPTHVEAITMDDLTVRRRRAAYRAAHRGTKEMDVLVGRYAEVHLDAWSEPQLARFEHFLALPDPMLQDWIFNPANVPDDAYMKLVCDIRKFHGLPEKNG